MLTNSARCLLLGLLLLSSCVSGRALPAAAPSALPVSPLTLPAPSVLLSRQAATVDASLYKSGDAFDTALPHNLATAQADASVRFAPQYPSGGVLSDVAYAAYRFDITGFAGGLDFAHGWVVDPSGGADAYLAVADIAADTWDWYSLSVGTAASVPDTAAHSAPDGTVLALVAVTGPGQPQLGALMLGNAPPQADVTTVSPLNGPPGLTVQLDGSSSSDPDGSIADYAWDPQGDGTYLAGSALPTTTLTYCAPGTYHPTLRVTDDQGATATASLAVTIGLGTQVKLPIDNSASFSADDVALCAVNGKPGLAYQIGAEVRYTHATTAGGQTWVASQTVADDGGYLGLDMKRAGGRPVIAYPTLAGELGCIWAQDAEGADWAQPVVAVPFTDVDTPAMPCLDLDSELPRLVYGDASDLFGGDLWLVRATSSNLVDWSTPLQLNESSLTASSPSLAWIDGLPAISFGTVTGSDIGRMHYARANQNWDVDWQPTLAPLATGSQIVYTTSLQAIGGLPAILYHEWPDRELSLLRAKDADGQQWNAPVPLNAGTLYSDVCFSFAIVNGVPCVAYGTLPAPGAGGLMLIYAANTQGTAWNEPLVLDDTALVAYVSLIDLNGRPAVAWSDNGTRDISYLTYLP